MTSCTNYEYNKSLGILDKSNNTKCYPCKDNKIDCAPSNIITTERISSMNKDCKICTLYDTKDKNKCLFYENGIYNNSNNTCRIKLYKTRSGITTPCDLKNEKIMNPSDKTNQICKIINNKMNCNNYDIDNKDNTCYKNLIYLPYIKSGQPDNNTCKYDNTKDFDIDNINCNISNVNKNIVNNIDNNKSKDIFTVNEMLQMKIESTNTDIKSITTDINKCDNDTKQMNTNVNTCNKDKIKREDELKKCNSDLDNNNKQLNACTASLSTIDTCKDLDNVKKEYDKCISDKNNCETKDLPAATTQKETCEKDKIKCEETDLSKVKSDIKTCTDIKNKCNEDLKVVNEAKDKCINVDLANCNAKL
jgi:hypothetical protein